MLCLSCRCVTSGYLCPGCRRLLKPAPPRVVEGSILVRSAFVHEGPARDIVHLLKYQGIRPAADVLVAVMAGLVPEDATALVPIPRVLARRVKFGVDPARLLAATLGRHCGLPVITALVAPLISSHHAGRSRERRSRPVFGVRSPVEPGAVVIDDVITTGSTFNAAVSALGVPQLSGLTATAVPR